MTVRSTAPRKTAASAVASVPCPRNDLPIFARSSPALLRSTLLGRGIDFQLFALI